MISDSNRAEAHCHNCGSGELQIAEGYDKAIRVTSDCKPWPPGGILAFCEGCGLVQTVVNEKWHKECNQIYSDYTIYHQSGGREQAAFNPASGAAVARSESIMNALRSHVQLPVEGRWLDVGCGNGAMLRAASGTLPAWSFCGSEFDDKYRQTIESIRGAERLFTGPVQDIPGTFDVISLVHVIEHIPHPRDLLQTLAARLKLGGLLLIEVPDCRQNCFSLMTADHCSHFSRQMLANVAATAGFDVLHAADDWVSKEITVLARPSAGTRSADWPSVPLGESEQVFQGWEALKKILADAELHAEQRPFGIFGTSIAATWLDAQLRRSAEFFVDEDSTRVGKVHFGRSILAPASLPDNATVYVALPPAIAARVVERLRSIAPMAQFACPPRAPTGDRG
jgi:SAM-dependent methyltransferase